MHVLRKLPILNKNIIQETKVLSAVERWAKDCKEHFKGLEERIQIKRENESKSIVKEDHLGTEKLNVKTEPKSPDIKTPDAIAEAVHSSTESSDGSKTNTQSNPLQELSPPANPQLTEGCESSTEPSSAVIEPNGQPSQSLTVELKIEASTADKATHRSEPEAGSCQTTSDSGKTADSVSSAAAIDVELTGMLASVGSEVTETTDSSRSTGADDDSQDGCLSQDDTSNEPSNKVLGQQDLESELEDVGHIIRELDELLDDWSQLKVLVLSQS